MPSRDDEHTMTETDYNTFARAYSVENEANLDVSAAMIDLARQRLGEGADLQVADLAARLPFADEEFDDVVASLALHYLEDRAEPLAELHRVRRSGVRRRLRRLFRQDRHFSGVALPEK